MASAFIPYKESYKDFNYTAFFKKGKHVFSKSFI